jgi:DNA primase
MSLEELKLRIKDTPITEVIGRYLPLTRQGNNTLAVCPFHDDHKPSMHVNDQKKMWMCFVDNMGGDAINFVMRYKNLDFVDALKDICDQLGWNFDDYHRESQVSPKIAMGKKILSVSAQIYRKLALSEQYKPFQDFLKNRGISAEVAKNYELGYANNTNAISQYLVTIANQADQKMALDLAKELGIIKDDQYREGSHYDTFRDRIVFPIWDQFGQVIGYTTRATNDSQKAKYMNSKESFLFNKKQLLYGFHLAKNYIRERDALIICEGNMDQIALYSNGFEHSVAIMGVALGDNSLRRILQMTKNVYLALDNDDAGLRAMERINQQFLEHGVIPKFVELGEYKDPDEFLQGEGQLALKEKIDTARTFLDYSISTKIPESIPEQTDGKLAVLKDIAGLLAPLGEDLAATERFIQVAKKLGLQSDSTRILETYRQQIKEDHTHKPAQVAAPSFEAAPHEPPQVHKVDVQQSLTKSERHLLQEVVAHPEILTHHEFSGLLDFVDRDEVKRYVLRLSEIVYEIDEKEFSSLLLLLNSRDDVDLEIKEVTGAALYRYTPSNLNEKVIDKMLEDLKLKLEIEQLRSSREVLINKKNQATDGNEKTNLLGEIIKIDQEINQLKNRKKSTLL